MTPGIHFSVPNEDYHNGPGISKSGLWTLATKTPAHYRYGERKDSAAFDLGTAAHLALLEPHEFDGRVICGPEDRRGNKWKDAELAADAQGGTLLTSGDFDKALRVRDAGEKCATLVDLRRGSICEASAYAVDPETGMLCRCRPDAFNPTAACILDLKTTIDGGRDAFAKSAANFGYHFQEAFYTDTLESARRAEFKDTPSFASACRAVEAFIFVVIEKTAPFLVSCYELAPSAVDEGREQYRRALATYAECARTDVWPGYPEDPEPLDIPAWAYRTTVRPTPEA